MSILVKICGVRTVQAAKVVHESGAKFMGLNFVPSSKRKVSVTQAEEIIKSLPKQGRPLLVGVFQDASLTEVKKIVAALKLDMVQLHGRETPSYAEKVGVPIIKTFVLEPDFDVEEASKKMTNYPAKYFLIDRIERGKGKRLNTKKVEELASRFPIILSGGLEPHSVRDSVQESGKIVGVDVAGGVETAEKQEHRKIRQFIREAQAAM